MEFFPPDIATITHRAPESVSLTPRLWFQGNVVLCFLCSVMRPQGAIVAQRRRSIKRQRILSWYCGNMVSTWFLILFFNQSSENISFRFMYCGSHENVPLRSPAVKSIMDCWPQLLPLWIQHCICCQALLPMACTQPMTKPAAILKLAYWVRCRTPLMDDFGLRTLYGPDQIFLATMQDTFYSILLPSLSHFTGIRPALWHEVSLCLLLFSSQNRFCTFNTLLAFISWQTQTNAYLK